MMKICICEDDALTGQSIGQSIEKWIKTTNNFDVEIRTFHSSEDLLERWSKNLQVHMFILDIEFPNEMSGMELARRIRLADPDVPIVFVSNYEEYVYQGYTFSALRYLRKPVLEADLFSCLDIAYRRYSLLYEESAMISIPGAKIALRHSEILYIEAHSPELSIVTVHFREPLVIRYRLAKILELLPSALFSPCHRSYIVNISHIRILKKTQLVLSNGAILPISEKYEDSVFDKFNHFHQEGFGLA